MQPAATVRADPGTSPGILRMSAPLVVSFWMRSLFALVDTAYAASLPDADRAVAAIGLTAPFEFAMIAVWVGLSTGLTSSLARAMGARDEGRIQQTLATSWKLVMGTVPVFLAMGAVCVLFASRIAPEPELARPFAIYSGVLLVGSAFSMFWSVIPDSIVKAHNDTRATMWAGIWSNVLNVVLNTVFTFLFHWGIFGIALSTVIGRFGGLAYALGRAKSHEAARQARGDSGPSTRNPHPYRAILGLAVPSSVAYLLMALESGILNLLLGRLDHATEAIAAYAIYSRILMLAITPGIATAVAMLPYVARRYGAGDLDGIRRGLREAHVAGAVYVLILVPILFFGAWPMARLFANSPLTTQYSAFALRLIPLACMSALPFFLARPVFEGMGRGRPGLYAAVLRYLVLTGPAAWLGIQIARAVGRPGLYGLLGGLVLASALSSAAFLAWIRITLRGEHARTTAGSLASPS